MSQPDVRIDLASLCEGLPGVTPAYGASIAQAAAVCLESQQHSPGVSLEVQGFTTTFLPLMWPPATDQVRRTWNDATDATEHGACAVACLLIIELTNYTVIERSWIDSGFDYWLGEQDAFPFQRRARLEVSGIRRGDVSEIKRRVEQKRQQIDRGLETSLPAYVVVVEFSRPFAWIEQR